MSISRKLAASIRSRRREMLDFVRELIALPTENPPGSAYPQCVRLLRKRLRDLRLPLDSPTPRHCVRATYGSGTRTLYFHGHYDVVPAAARDQFLPFVRNGRLFGRGSSDMKSGLAATVYAILALCDSGVRLDGKIVLTMVPDEETAGARGTRALVESDLIDPTAIGMLTPEPTSGVIWNSSRGAVSLRVTVRGKAVHSGLSHSARNAFEGMLHVAQGLRALQTQIAPRKTRFPVRPESARHSILMLGGQCEGGTNFNVVPAQCSFTVDRRTNPEENLAAETKRILHVLDRSKRRGVDLDFEFLQQADASATPQGHPLSKALEESVSEVVGKPPRFEMCPGLLETRFYAQKGIPALAYGPGLLAVSHGPHEFVPLRNIENCALVYALTAVRLLGAS
jgi:succinyl-diaminopimelate desuccinylase